MAEGEDEGSVALVPAARAEVLEERCRDLAVQPVVPGQDLEVGVTGVPEVHRREKVAAGREHVAGVGRAEPGHVVLRQMVNDEGEEVVVWLCDDLRSERRHVGSDCSAHCKDCRLGRLTNALLTPMGCAGGVMKSSPRNGSRATRQRRSRSTKGVHQRSDVRRRSRDEQA